MVMALSILHQSQTLTLIAGYENGLATVAHLSPQGTWTTTYQAQCHSQPILSLDVSPDTTFFLTSSADAIIAKHPLPPSSTDPTAAIQTTPLKTLNTKHAGQQSLRIRSDARVFATAGWDARVRVYSAKTLAAVAVLKWHTAGCYAAAFAEVDIPAPPPAGPEGEDDTSGGVNEKGNSSQDASGEGKEMVAVPKLVEMTVRKKRERQARTGHWLAAGSKDGKVSLWDVF
jgi:WD40 repeat protein